MTQVLQLHINQALYGLELRQKHYDECFYVASIWPFQGLHKIIGSSIHMSTQNKYQVRSPIAFYETSFISECLKAAIVTIFFYC